MQKSVSYRGIASVIILLVYDIVASLGAYFMALFVRFELRWSLIIPEYLSAYYKAAPYYIIAVPVIFAAFRMYSSVWRYAGVSELIRCVCASFLASVVHTIIITMILYRMPMSYYVLGALMQMVLLVGARFGIRVIYTLMRIESLSQNTEEKSNNIMVIGAGDSGVNIIRELKKNSKIGKPVCIIDDDALKNGRFVEGIKVIGNRHEIEGAVKKYNIDEIYFAISTASPLERKEILEICSNTACKVRVIPSLSQIANGVVSIASMRDVNVEDLLGREPVKIDDEGVFKSITGQVVLVTGGGGSIGSELCRQIAGHRPKKLIIFDIYENGVYDLQQEIIRKYPGIDLKVLIGSVRDSRRVMQVFSDYRPNVVFHAAAHKHVPLMEDSPCEAIKNNVIGTYKVAYAAVLYGCERFTMISTDKAVNPTNIMGASKRICEMVIQEFSRAVNTGNFEGLPMLGSHYSDSNSCPPPQGEVPSAEGVSPATQFSLVRFGNVLGSNGSVIPLFKKQIESGGPVTVTHPDIIRYFMTIPEAVSLVLQAFVYAKGGEIFVLDMGSPIKIADLAKKLIRYSGYVPNEDIKIEFTGLRPGEKLFEEKLMNKEGLSRTDNKLIHIARPIEIDRDDFVKKLIGLMDACRRQDGNAVKQITEEITGTYKPA